MTKDEIELARAAIEPVVNYYVTAVQELAAKMAPVLAAYDAHIATLRRAADNYVSMLARLGLLQAKEVDYVKEHRNGTS